MSICGSNRLRSVRGTVSLVALCFVAVLGISLASYIAICSRAMTLSNRSFQAGLSKQLAEAGIEEALRAFNKNDWSDWTNNGYSADWSLDTTNKRATATLTIPTSSFGQGTTATVKIRVDNYDAAHLGSTWSSAKTYRINDLVGYNGVWYRSVQHDNLNKTPGLSLAWWVPAPIPWTWNSNNTYTLYDVVNYNGSWYRSTSSSNTSTPPTNWASIPSFSFSWSSGTTYTAGSYVYITDRWYRCVADCTGVFPPNSSYWRTDAPYIAWSWRFSPAKTYKFNDVVYYDGKWWRCIREYYSNSSSEYPGNSGNEWEEALVSQEWVSGLNYNLRDTVYYGSTGQWYRCIRAHASSSSITPYDATYWTNTPLLSTTWDSGKQYSLNDTVRHNGIWYISIHSGGSNIAQNPATGTTYWIGANTTNTSYTWNTTTAYSVGNYRCYGGVWYRCTAGHTNKSPNDTGYWTAVTAPVVYAEATITIANSPSLKTQLRALIAPLPLFPNAAAATGTISGTSGGTVDSYDSTTGTYASQVNSATNYSAVIAAGYTSDTAITLSSTTVKGYVAAPSSSTSPYAPLISIGTSASVKSSTSPTSPKIDPARVSRSPYIPQFDTLPLGGLATNWSTTPQGTALELSTTVNIGTPGATTPSRYYYNGDLTIGNATITTLEINGPVILYINGDLTITQSGSTGRIDINDSGSAEIHVAGAFKADINGEGILNHTANPKSLIIISDTTSTDSHFYSEGVNDLYGVIYLPYSTSNTGYYNNNTTTEIFGAVSANKITYSGANMNIHYDTSLRYATFGGVDQPYAVSEWRELPLTEQASMP